MTLEKIVMVVNVLDNADILPDYLAWHLSLGIDLILANDFGSTDGSREILQQFSRKGKVVWSHHPDKKIDGYDPSSHLARRARDEYAADWVILTDTDEFLTVKQGDLHTLLQSATDDDLAVITVQRFNMIGPLPSPGKNSIEELTVRIDRSIPVSHEHNRSSPYIFVYPIPKTIVRALGFVAFGPGGHSAVNEGGRSGDCDGLRILHYPYRGFSEFELKVANIVAFMEENPHLPSWWGGHWRRLIRLRSEGRLREEFEAQFVSRARTEELIADGTCSFDTTIADWYRHNKSSCSRLGRTLQRLFGQSR